MKMKIEEEENLKEDHKTFHYQPYICAVESKVEVIIDKYPIVYDIIIQNSYRLDSDYHHDNHTSSLSLILAAAALNVSILTNTIILQADTKHIEVIMSGPSLNNTMETHLINSYSNNQHHHLISYSFSITSTQIGIIGVTLPSSPPPSSSSSSSSSSFYHYQIREIIDEIMCLRVTRGTKYQILILLNKDTDHHHHHHHDTIITSLHEYVDVFVINNDAQGSGSHDYHNIAEVTSVNEGKIINNNYQTTTNNNINNNSNNNLTNNDKDVFNQSLSCDGQWFEETSQKIVILNNRRRDKAALITFHMINNNQYHLGSNIIT